MDAFYRRPWGKEFNLALVEKLTPVPPGPYRAHLLRFITKGYSREEVLAIGINEEALKQEGIEFPWKKQ